MHIVMLNCVALSLRLVVERTRKYLTDLRVRLAERTIMYLLFLHVRSLTYITSVIESVTKGWHAPLGGGS